MYINHKILFSLTSSIICSEKLSRVSLSKQRSLFLILMIPQTAKNICQLMMSKRGDENEREGEGGTCEIQHWGEPRRIATNKTWRRLTSQWQFALFGEFSSNFEMQFVLIFYVNAGWKFFRHNSSLSFSDVDYLFKSFLKQSNYLYTNTHTRVAILTTRIVKHIRKITGVFLIVLLSVSELPARFSANK